MSSAPPSPIPTRTVLGERGRGDRLAAQHFHLVLLDTEREGTLYPLGSAVPRIGKAPDNDVVLAHPTVSRNHRVNRLGGLVGRAALRAAAAHRPHGLHFERECLTRLLSRTQGNIARAAREAELDRKHLYSLLHKYGLVQPEEG
ncbi:MAG TPA: hypothetical protein VE057_10000 [Archangium sp.]|nr:hypothetical protein [Archangium sp.]